MKDDKNLHRLLNRPPVPERLEESIRENWQQQISPTENHRSIIRFLAVASVFVFVFGLMLINSYFTPPKLVTAALNDIASDKMNNFGITLPVEALVVGFGINLPTGSMPIKLAKKCSLNGSETTHLKLVGEKQGEVHLFIKQNEFDIRFWKARHGVADTMPWRLLKLRKDLSILVLYSADMNEQKVESMIKNIIYA